MSRVRRLSVRCRWAIVLGATALSFVVLQRASATPPGITGRATAQFELDALVVSASKPRAPYTCTDARRIGSKPAWDLSLQPAEQCAPQSMPSTCVP